MRFLSRLYWETRYVLAPRWDVPMPEALRAVLSEESARCSGGSALDLGCGAGQVALYLARRGLRVTAVDVSSLALLRARVRARRAGVRVRLERVDVLARPFRSALGPHALVVDVGLFHGLAPGQRATYASHMLQWLGRESVLVLMGLRPGADRRVAGIRDGDLDRFLPELRVHSSTEVSGMGLPTVLYVLRRD